MKLTNFLKSRQQGLSRNISINNKTICFNDIQTTLEVNNWNILDIQKFRDFISKYTFPNNEEFSKTDRNGIRSNIPEPQLLIQRKADEQPKSSAVIAMYLYKKSQLTGDSLLHIRSINKLEQMWLPYFINLKLTSRDNPKVHKRQFFEYSESTDINFSYSLLESSLEINAKVKILAFAFKSHVLLMYIFDKNNLPEEELLTLIDSIKAAPNIRFGNIGA